MEISSNSELLHYATPEGSIDPTEDSFLEDFEVIREGDGDDNCRYPIRNCRTPPTETVIPSKSVISSSASSSTASYDEAGSQLSSMDDVKHYIEENTKLKDRLKELKETLNLTKSQMTEIVEGYTKACEEDKKKYKSCQELARDAVTENTLLKEEIVSLQKQMETLEAEKAAAVKSIVQETDFVKLESLETQIKEKIDQINSQEKKLEDLATHLEHEKAQNTELKNFIRTHQSQTDEIEKLKQENLTQQEKIKEMNNIHLGQGETIEKLHAQNQHQIDDIASLRDEIIRCQKKISQMNAAQIERDEAIEMLRAQYESTLLSMSTTDRDVAAKNEQCSALSQTLSAKEVRINELQQALAEKSHYFDHANKALNERDAEYNSLYQHYLTKNSQLEELNHAIENAEQLRQKYQEKIYRLEEEVGNSKQIIGNFDAEVRVLKTSVAALSTENESISHWKAQCDAFQADYVNMVSQRDSLDAQIFELNKELTELRDKTQKQQEELDQLHNTHIRFAQEHINREPTSDAASTQSGDLISHVINNFKRGVSLLWDGDGATGGGDSTTTGNEAMNASSIQRESNQNTSNIAGSSELPPCPVCGKVFYGYGNLQEHSWDCGKSRISTSSHMDPFIFVPQQ